MHGLISILSIAGGVALLLFGVRYLRRGLDRLFGQRLGTWMNRLANTHMSGFFSGLMVSIIAPSSTTMSLLAVQTVQAGQMSFRQMIAVMLGANIGLTIMVQLIAFDLYHYAPILILIGVVLYQFTRGSRSRGVGQVVLSIGFIFLAMTVIREAVKESGLNENADFMQLMDIATRYPLMLALIAMVLSFVLQSSTATIGLVIGLAAGGALPLSVAAPVVLGANVGLTITTLIVGYRQIDSRRLALGNMFLKVAVAGLILLSMILFTVPDVAPENLPWVVAQVHTGYNLLLALIGLPLIGALSTLLEKIVPAPTADEQRPFGPKFITTGPIGGMALALGLSMREIMHMTEIVSSMLDDVWRALKNNDERLARQVAERDDRVDLLDTAIKKFLTRLVMQESAQTAADEQMRQLRYVNELETIGDIIDKNISELVVKKIRLGVKFSEEGATELDDFHEKVVENMKIATTAFPTSDRVLAQQLLRHKNRLDEYEKELRDRHFTRLTTGLTESHETSAIHLDLLTHLKRINSALSHVAFAILAQPTDEPERQPE